MMLVTAVALLIVALISLKLGAVNTSLAQVIQAFFQPVEDDFNQLIIRTIRLPRVLAGMLAGMALAVSGALMQGLSRNPLASPGILGINAGAAFAVVMALTLFGQPPLLTYALFAGAGAALAAVSVYYLASMGAGGMTPIKLTLSGAVFTVFLSAVTTAVLIFDEDTLDQVRFWTAGSLAGREMPMLYHSAPYILSGVIIAVLLGKAITALSLGNDIATSLGQNPSRIKKIALLAVVLSAGGATALVGPIGFVGLVVPHIARLLVGTDYRRILPMSALMGALLVSIADIFSRILIPPQELPAGIVMGIIGAPFFIYLARKKL